MVTDGKRFVDLGPFGIVREAFEIFCAHAKTFLLIQIALVLPCTLLAMASNYLLIGDSNPLFTTGSKMTPQTSAAATVSFHGSLSTQNPVEIIGLSAAYLLLNMAIGSVWISGNLYAVGMIYTNSKFSFVDVIRVIPRLWKRLMLTNLYAQVGFFASLILIFGLMLPLVVGPVSAAWKWLLLLPMFFVLVALFYWSLIAHLAETSSVLDENYGWAAFGEGFKLLRERIWVVAGVLFINLITMVPLVLVLSSLIVKTSFSLEKLVAGVIVLVANSFLSQFYVLCEGVTYVSLKAYHGEDIADPLFSRGLTKWPYKAVENDSQLDDAKEDSPV